ncbi:hypothetical protein L6452_43416 [Arctium lappa]|uniref:Uncharacterized protein n=1 Tax=Arctium lappa TaxID=4217 RepID=A0ACB8XDH6_ARCLA|nr:hypothetical protein L6452_43416 [Arctium lappa]
MNSKLELVTPLKLKGMLVVMILHKHNGWTILLVLLHLVGVISHSWVSESTLTRSSCVHPSYGIHVWAEKQQ